MTTPEGHTIAGVSLSSIVTLKEQEEVNPEPSVTRYDTVVVPNGNTSLLAKPRVRFTVRVLQLSELVGAE